MSDQRVAKKIVKRFQADPRAAQGYSLEQITRAHQCLKTTLDPAQIEAWRAPKVERQAQVQSETAAAQERAVLRRSRAAAQRAEKQKLEAQRALARSAKKALPEPVPVEQTETVPEAEQVTASSDGLGVAELRALCKDKGLTGYSKLKKDELIALLAKS